MSSEQIGYIIANTLIWTTVALSAFLFLRNIWIIIKNKGKNVSKNIIWLLVAIILALIGLLFIIRDVTVTAIQEKNELYEKLKNGLEINKELVEKNDTGLKINNDVIEENKKLGELNQKYIKANESLTEAIKKYCPAGLISSKAQP